MSVPASYCTSFHFAIFLAEKMYNNNLDENSDVKRN